MERDSTSPELIEEQPEAAGTPLRGDWLDVVALTVAAYQILFPILLLMFGVVGLVYLVLWLWAGA